MFDLGWTELLVIGIVALIVIGPKDLPVLFRNVGRWVGRIRGMARDFSQAMNDAADEAGVKDVQTTLRAATNPVGTAMDGVKKATQDLTKGLDVGALDPTKYNPDSETGKLAAERAEQSAKIKAHSARKAAEKLQEQADAAMAKAAEAEAALTPPDPEAPTSPDETKT